MLYALLVFCAVLLSLLRPARGGSIMVTAGGTHPLPTFHWADINGVKKAHLVCDIHNDWLNLSMRMRVPDITVDSGESIEGLVTRVAAGEAADVGHQLQFGAQATILGSINGSVTENAEAIAAHTKALEAIGASSTTASGAAATALGEETTASGARSTALGYQTVASGGESFTSGTICTASGARSTAMGYNTSASAPDSTALRTVHTPDRMREP